MHAYRTRTIRKLNPNVNHMQTTTLIVSSDSCRDSQIGLSLHKLCSPFRVDTSCSCTHQQAFYITARGLCASGSEPRMGGFQNLCTNLITCVPLYALSTLTRPGGASFPGSPATLLLPFLSVADAALFRRRLVRIGISYHLVVIVLLPRLGALTVATGSSICDICQLIDAVVLVIYQLHSVLVVHCTSYQLLKQY